MGAYGHVRVTRDLDIFINATEENAKKAMQALVDYGIPSKNLNENMFLEPKMIGIGQPPLRIEVLKKLDTIDFNFAYQRKESTNIDGIKVNVVSLDDLVLLKKAAVKGRNKPRDKEDLNFLLNKQQDKKKNYQSLVDRIKATLSQKKGNNKGRKP